MATPDPSRALVFGEVADEYAARRPTYPEDAVTWLTEGARVVVDLGSGTGQLTGQLLARGLEVHAVEPDPRMLAVLVGLVWNTVKPVHRWEFELAGMDPDRKGLDDAAADTSAPEPFPEFETTVRSFPWDWPVTPDHFRAYFATHSAVIVMDDESRAARLDRVWATVAQACADRGTDSVPLHHEAYCVRWHPTGA